MDCKTVGDTNPDIAGLGIIYAFVIQGGLSVVLSILSILLEAYPVFVNRHLGVSGTTGSLEKWVVCINEILASISQTQILNADLLARGTGISLLIAVLVQHGALSLYHLHIVYDVVSLTAVSACAALANVIRVPKLGITVGPHAHLMVFACFYLAYCVILGMRLSNWDNNVAGQCYDTRRISTSGATHPLADYAYLSVTCFYMFATIRSCWMCGDFQSSQHAENQRNIRVDETFSQPDFDSVLHQAFQVFRKFVKICRKIWDNRHKPFQWSLVKRLMKSIWESGPRGPTNLKSSVLAPALLQFPLHTYMIFALRHSNENRLSGDSENTWGFGQIVALVLLGSTLLQSIGTILKYLEHSNLEDAPRTPELQDREQRIAQAA